MIARRPGAAGARARSDPGWFAGAPGVGQNEGMHFVVDRMRQHEAEEIAHEWRYEEAYALYNADADADRLAQLLDPETRGEAYFAAHDGDTGRLVGFFIMAPCAGAVELGLGMLPELTGQGWGRAFVRAGLRHLAEAFPGAPVTLGVAEFNERAIRLYASMGFVETGRELQEHRGAVFPFVRMLRAAD